MWTASKIFIIKCFDPTLRITKSCSRVVQDNRFEVQYNLTCMNTLVSQQVPCAAGLAYGRQNMEKKDRKFSCSLLAVDISRCRASCFAQQPPVSMGGSILCHRARNKGGCIGRKPESLLESGLSVGTNFVFCQTVYWRERQATTIVAILFIRPWLCVVRLTLSKNEIAVLIFVHFTM